MNAPPPNPAALLLVVVVAGVLMALLAVVRRRAVDAALAGDPFPLHEAVRSGDEQRVAELLAEGADVNEVDSARMTPLLYAVHLTDSRITELLCEAGADVGFRGPTGETALGQAGDAEVAAVLRRSGATEK